MIEFLLFVGAWLLIGFLLMRFVVIPWDGSDANTWTVPMLICFTFAFPLVMAIMLSIILIDWSGRQKRNGKSPSDTIKKVYGLK